MSFTMMLQSSMYATPPRGLSPAYYDVAVSLHFFEIVLKIFSFFTDLYFMCIFENFDSTFTPEEFFTPVLICLNDSLSPYE